MCDYPDSKKLIVVVPPSLFLPLCRYRMCTTHMKTPQFIIGNVKCRFCQKCGKFHPLDDFDGMRRSCRAGLERHKMKQKFLRMKKAGFLDQSTSFQSLPGTSSHANTSSKLTSTGAPLSTFSLMPPTPPLGNEHSINSLPSAINIPNSDQFFTSLLEGIEVDIDEAARQLGVELLGGQYPATCASLPPPSLIFGGTPPNNQVLQCTPQQGMRMMVSVPVISPMMLTQPRQSVPTMTAVKGNNTVSCMPYGNLMAQALGAGDINWSILPAPPSPFANNDALDAATLSPILKLPDIE